MVTSETQMGPSRIPTVRRRESLSQTCPNVDGSIYLLTRGRAGSIKVVGAGVSNLPYALPRVGYNHSVLAPAGRANM